MREVRMSKYRKALITIIFAVIILVSGNLGKNPDLGIQGDVDIFYTFRTEEQYQLHYEKHGDEFGDISKDEYLILANSLIQDESGEVLSKPEQEDDDTVYYREATNEFLILSDDGYIRTFFRPDDGIEYYNRQ